MSETETAAAPAAAETTETTTAAPTAKKAIRHNCEAMNTEFTLFFDGDSTDPELALGAAQSAFKRLERIEQVISHFIASSDIARINTLTPDETYELYPEALDCLNVAATLAAATNRAFDPSAGTLVDFWKNFRGNTEVLDDCESSPDWRRVWEQHRVGELSFDPESRLIKCVVPGSRLDLGAIGKGFALDEMAKVIEEEWDLSHVLLSAGGSTVLALDAPLAKPAGWKIGFGGETRLPYLNLARRALSSSGIENQPTHLVNPRNGHLVTRNELVRAVAPTAAEADALSTAFFVMSREEADTYCLDHPEHHALFAIPSPTDGVPDRFFIPCGGASLTFQPREPDEAEG